MRKMSIVRGTAHHVDTPDDARTSAVQTATANAFLSLQLLYRNQQQQQNFRVVVFVLTQHQTLFQLQAGHHQHRINRHHNHR